MTCTAHIFCLSDFFLKGLFIFKRIFCYLEKLKYESNAFKIIHNVYFVQSKMWRTVLPLYMHFEYFEEK